MVAQALLDAERHVAEHLTRGLETGQRRLLDALLLPHAGTNLSGLGWVRQPPGKPGRKTFAVIIRRLALLRDIGIDPDIAAGIHPERLRRLCFTGRINNVRTPCGSYYAPVSTKPLAIIVL